MLHMPQLAKCTDRKVLAKVNPISGEPETWLDPKIMESKNLYTLSFDFFVNWNIKQIKDEIWIKRNVDHNIAWPNTSSSDLLEWIINLESKQRLNNLYIFCDNNNFNSEYFLFKEQDANYWSGNPDEIIKYNLKTQKARTLNPNDVQNEIYKLRGSRPSLGPDGLKYGTTSLECYLSNKPDFWPGDVDDLIIDDNGIPKAVIEYKKHNKNSPIQDQSIMNYLKKDKKKYQSLGLLRDRLSSNHPIKIFVIFYSTNPKVTQIKIEEVAGTYNNLKPINSWEFPLPVQNNPTSIDNYCESFINLL